jgi:hypothetical protein
MRVMPMKSFFVGLLLVVFWFNYLVRNKFTSDEEAAKECSRSESNKSENLKMPANKNGDQNFELKDDLQSIKIEFFACRQL